MNNLEIVSEEIIRQQGSYYFIRRYIKGWHPEYGLLHFGYSGKETVQEITVLKSSCNFIIKN